jgi:hypothetical protein
MKEEGFLKINLQKPIAHVRVFTHLDVAVNDALLVHVPHRFGALGKVGPHVVLVQQAVLRRPGSPRAQKLLQVPAARPLQDNVQVLAL